MGAFDRFYNKKIDKKKLLKLIIIYMKKLKELSENEISASVNQLINACIENLIKTKNI